jgi:hypothetical protein
MYNVGRQPMPDSPHAHALEPTPTPSEIMSNWVLPVPVWLLQRRWSMHAFVVVNAIHPIVLVLVLPTA